MNLSRTAVEAARLLYTVSSAHVERLYTYAKHSYAIQKGSMDISEGGGIDQ